MIYNLL